eukprot:TRINITY_DN15012_c0_g1_i8.p1 TRINITY_DN15012_c0_g1~~TRINITY_DN15012_c0_g1_i8.p1  ORF type:complete len:1104 (-),score=197.92 TRINITY_DN15012_c0_g1_i8:553-3864(-)
METATVPHKVAYDMADSQNSTTWTMAVLRVYCSITAFSILIGLAIGGLSPRVQVVDLDDIWHARTAILLIVSAAVTEMCFLAASSANRQLLMDVDGEEEIKLPGSGDSWLTLAEYACKLLTGLYLWLFSGGVVHSDTLALGGARPVYAARFAQWSVAVPILVLISNKAFIESWPSVLRRSAPSLVAAFLYVWASWLMEVTPSHLVRWPMMVLSMSGAVFVSIDQVYLASKHREAPLFGIKSGMLAYQLLSFIVYACVFVCGRFGVLPSGSEQFFYAYCDSTVKVLQGAILAMIRNREGAAEIHRWWLASTNMHKDVQQLLETAQVPIFSLDLRGMVTQWNSSMTKLTGLQSEKVQGQCLLDIVSADCKGMIKEQLHACTTQADATLVEVAIPTSKASKGILPDLRILAMTFVPKNNKSGMIEGVTAIGQDLSDLADMKVTQERKNALMAMLSHEIRSPLHGMMGLTDAMLQMPSSQPLQRQLGMVKGCAARLLDLVTNVMDVAQNEKMKLEGVEQPKPDARVDFGAIIDEACTMIGNSVDKTNKPLLKSGVCLENKLAGSSVPLIRGDHYKCTQMIYNFLTNACKFTQQGSISLGARHLPEKKLLEIHISDTGKGISEEGQKRIFKPFEQENRGDTRSFQGIGLGLSVCKGIAELHQGTIRVESRLGHGSTFTISLPCEENLGQGAIIGKEHGVYGNHTQASQAPTSSLRPEPESSVPVKKPEKHYMEKREKLDAAVYRFAPPAVTRTDTKGSGLSVQFEGTPLILSVDDDEVNQEVIKNTLGDFCEVQIAMDGPEALDILRRLSEQEDRIPDLVLLDIQMPGMTGFEVCETIRTQFAYKRNKLPVTMVSAKAPSHDAALKAFDCGSTDYISKPFNREILKCKVKAALDMKASVGPTGSVGVVAKEALQRIHAKERETANAVARAKLLEKMRDQVQEKLTAKEQLVQELNQNLQLLEKKLQEQEQAQQTLKERPAAERTHATQLSTLQGVELPVVDFKLPASSHGQHLRIIKQLTGKVVSAKGAINLLSSRLRLCRSSSKQCYQLLQDFLDSSPCFGGSALSPDTGTDAGNDTVTDSSECPYHGLTLIQGCREACSESIYQHR